MTDPSLALLCKQIRRQVTTVTWLLLAQAVLLGLILWGGTR